MGGRSKALDILKGLSPSLWDGLDILQQDGPLWTGVIALLETWSGPVFNSPDPSRCSHIVTPAIGRQKQEDLGLDRQSRPHGLVQKSELMFQPQTREGATDMSPLEPDPK